MFHYNWYFNLIDLSVISEKQVKLHKEQNFSAIKWTYPRRQIRLSFNEGKSTDYLRKEDSEIEVSWLSARLMIEQEWPLMSDPKHGKSHTFFLQRFTHLESDFSPTARRNIQ